MSTTADSPAFEEAAPGAGPLATQEAVFRLRQAILDGQHWFEALLDAIAIWRLPEETVDGRTYRYLISHEAFDWLLLAERLLDEVLDLVPAAERDALLWHNRWPAGVDMDDDAFAQRLGPAKHSAHLNYLYGVLVEEALQLSVEEDIHKEVRCRAWSYDERFDESMYQRIYGKGREELTALYYEATGIALFREAAYADWKAFTYWLFRLRLKGQDKARLASDTRRGLAQLTRMELAVSERRLGARLDEAVFSDRYTL